MKNQQRSFTVNSVLRSTRPTGEQDVLDPSCLCAISRGGMVKIILREEARKNPFEYICY
jgi:hypothetical protein